MGDARGDAAHRIGDARPAGLRDASKFGEASIAIVDQALLAIHRGQQDHVWMNGTYDWIEDALDRAGLRSKVIRPLRQHGERGRPDRRLRSSRLPSVVASRLAP
jgi:hypothetical protein